MATDPSRIQRRPGIEFETPPNTRMSIKAVGEDRQHWCTFVGLEKNRYILLRLDQELGALAFSGNQVTIKYIIENLVFGFMTIVIGAIKKPFPLLFLEYPALVEQLDLRRENRAICFVSAIVYWEGAEYHGHILDISSSGCRFAADVKTVSHLADLKTNNIFFCQFNIDGQEDIYAKCAARNVSQNDSKICIGIEFLEVSKDIAQHIENFVININHFRISCS